MGVGLFGVTDLSRSRHVDHFRRWLADGKHGTMHYLAREDSVQRRSDIGLTLEGARSVLVIGVDYAPDPISSADTDPSRAVIARYARGADYHDVLLGVLEELVEVVRAEHPAAGFRPYVDTGPLLEREWAREAGLGWFGRNAMLIHPERGSYFVLGLLLTDAALSPTHPFEDDRCGTCRACLDACPTGALLGRDDSGAPVLDARLCISYLTIEAKGAIPATLRPKLGNRVFGCDICQEVCPWNDRFGRVTERPDFAPRPELDGVGLLELTASLLEMSEKGYQRAYAGSPLARPRRRGMLRNLCVGLGNWLAGCRGDIPAEALDVLGLALDDAQPLVRSHAAWALGRTGAEPAEALLRTRLASEADVEVRLEIEAALSVDAQRPSG